MEKLTGFAQSALPFFQANPLAQLELRTKSVATQILEKTEALSNVVTAQFYPSGNISDALKGCPVRFTFYSSDEKNYADRGWKLGVRLDPIIDCKILKIVTSHLYRKSFAEIPKDSIHSVSLGPFRLLHFPKNGKTLSKNLYFLQISRKGRSANYNREIENQRLETCEPTSRATILHSEKTLFLPTSRGINDSPIAIS